MVGEMGPELYTPSLSGHIVPNGAGAGGAPVNVIFNINTPDADSFRRSERQLYERAGFAIGQAQKRDG